MALSIVPLLRLNLPENTWVKFGSEFLLVSLPDWVKNDELLPNLGYQNAQSVKAAQHCLIAKYEASSIGEPDPSWTGKSYRSIQDTKSEAAAMANLALWLVQPSAVCYPAVLHALEWPIPGQTDSEPIIQRLETHTPLYCHPDDINRQPSLGQITVAGQMCDALRSIKRNNAVWTAARSFWAALVTPERDIRYSLFWIGIEALFGPESSSGEITYKLSQRIAFLTAADPVQAKQMFKDVKKCYGMRSTIVHGRWNDDPKMDEMTGTTERIVRASFLRILRDHDLLDKFQSKDRDPFLEDMVFSRYG
jgi:hypothetical protein